MRENITAVPVPALLSTRARIANTMDKKVEATAASCGLFPNGAATKKDHEARTSPSSRWTAMTSKTFVAVKIRKCHTMATISQAGK